MSPFTLGVHGLPAAEAGLVRALLSLSEPAVSERWSFSATGPCDVLIADGAAPGAQDALAARGARELVLLGAAAAGSGPNLARPLRAEQLGACLRSFADRTSPVTAAAAEAPTGAAEDIVPADENARRRYRLRRWPPAELLRAEPLRIRMASQLSRRFLSAGDLARLTNAQDARVQTFLQLLSGFGLLQAEAESPLAAAAAPRAPAVSVARAPVGLGLGLVQSIRRRLGL